MPTKINEKTGRGFQLYFYCFILGVMLLVVCKAAFSCHLFEPGMGDPKSAPFDHWMLYQEEGREELEVPADRHGNRVVKAGAGEPVSLTAVLPDIDSSNHVLFFRSSNQKIRVYVNEVRIYSFGDTGLINLLKTPGNVWNEAVLTREMSGQSIRIESISPYKAFSGVFQPVYFAAESEVPRIMLKNCGAGLSVGLLLLMAGTIFLVSSFAYHNSYRFSWLKYIGQFYLFISIWILGESKGLELFIHNPALVYFATLLSLMMAPLAFMMYMKNVYLSGSKALNIHIYVYGAYIIACVCLQFLIPLDLLEMIPMTFVLILILSLSGLAVVIKEGRKAAKRSGSIPQGFSIIIFIAGASIDVGHFFIHGFSSLGVATGIAVCIFMLFHLNCLIRQTIKTEHTLVQLKTELAQSNMELLLSQIKPHFLYNSLNSISYLCKTNPELADQAVIHFSNFLRANMNSIEQKGLIRFEKEMEHIENYVFLEKIRFPGIDVIYDLQYTDFDIPPLTLQPVVENAIKHGVSKNIDGGRVIISTSRAADEIIIKISDTGVGFETEQMDIMESTGLRNIERRLQTLCRAEINIESQPGKGTSVVILIPAV